MERRFAFKREEVIRGIIEAEMKLDAAGQVAAPSTEKLDAREIALALAGGGYTYTLEEAERIIRSAQSLCRSEAARLIDPGHMAGLLLDMADEADDPQGRLSSRLVTP